MGLQLEAHRRAEDGESHCPGALVHALDVRCVEYEAGFAAIHPVDISMDVVIGLRVGQFEQPDHAPGYVVRLQDDPARGTRRHPEQLVERGQLGPALPLDPEVQPEYALVELE